MMKYDLSILKPGDIALVKSKSVISYLIAMSFYRKSDLPWRLNSLPSNHTGVFVNKECNCIIESLFWGVTATPVDDYIKAIEAGKEEIIFARTVPALTGEQQYNIEEFLMKQLGKKYDFKSFVSHFWRIVLRLPPLRRVHSYTRYYCTELAADALKSVGVDIFPGWPTPYTVEKRISELKLEIVAHWHK